MSHKALLNASCSCSCSGRRFFSSPDFIYLNPFYFIAVQVIAMSVDSLPLPGRQYRAFVHSVTARK